MEITYNKLVRDKIPEIIQGDGKIPRITKIQGMELIRALIAKLNEEGEEYLESLETGEIADILEVVHGLIDAHGETYENIELIRLEKKSQRGGFTEGVFLETVETPE